MPPEPERPWSIPSLDEGLDLSDDYWGRLTEAATSDAEVEEMDPELALEFWCRWLVERPRQNYDAVVLITGDEGSGKSTLALRMALRCAELQKVEWRPSEVCFSSVDLITAYRHVTKGKPVWYDEGVRGTMAGEQMTPEQRALVKALALVRESGAILFALYPSIWLAAKQIRARRACLWIHVVRRGLGRVHERDRRLNYLPTDALGLTISPRAPHVAWDPFAPKDVAWREYLDTKTAKLQEFLAETERDLKIRASEPTSKAETPAARAARRRALGAARSARWRAKHAHEGADLPSEETRGGT